jgi:hypothetical protein
MLRVDRRRNVVGDDRAPPTGAHNGDDYIPWKDCVSLQLFVFFWRESSPVPRKLVVHSIVDSEHGDACVGEFGMEELTAKWAGAYGVRLVCSEFINSGRREFIASFGEQFDEGGGEERVGEFQGIAASYGATGPPAPIAP